MFFEFPKSKVKIMIALALLLLSGVSVAVFSNKEWNIAAHTQVFWRSLAGELNYLRYKIKNGNANITMAFNEDDRRSAQSIPVLVYHGVPYEGEGNVPLDTFAEQMYALKSAGWHTITLSQFEDFIEGSAQVPEKSFLLTFDDGRKDTYYPANPILRDLGFHAVMFVITGHSLISEQTGESRFYLSEFELEKMLVSGRWELESHGRFDHNWFPIDESLTPGHFLSNRLWLVEEGRLETPDEFRQRIADDLRNSREDMRTRLGIDSRFFAYPFSDYGQDTENFPGADKIVLAEVPKVYDYAFYQVFRSKGETFNYPTDNYRDDPFMIKRIEVDPSWDGERLITELSAGVSKSLPYFNRDFGVEWRDSWGEVRTGEDLELRAVSASTGAAAFLNGSYLWRDYRFDINLDWILGSDVLLSVRQVDDNNQYLCAFGREFVRVKERIAGELVTVAEQKFSITPRDEMSLSAAVQGNVVRCYVDGTLVLGAIMPESFANGGVGIQIWDEVGNLATISVNYVEVNEI